MGIIPQKPREHPRPARRGGGRHLSGFEGDCHADLTRSSCVRVTAQHPKGTEIRNTGQLSIFWVEELDPIAGQIGLDRLEPDLLAASIMVQGIADVTHRRSAIA